MGAVQQSRQASEALQERHAAVPAVKRNRSNAWDLEKSNDFFPVGCSPRYWRPHSEVFLKASVLSVF